MQPIVLLALAADEHHFAAAVRLEHGGAERLLESLAVVRKEALGAAYDGDGAPVAEPVLVDVAREIAARLRVADDDLGPLREDDVDDFAKLVLAAERAVDVVVAADDPIDLDLHARLQRWEGARGKAPIMERVLAEAVAGPPVAAKLRRLAPVFAVRLVAEEERLAGGAARRLVDRRARADTARARLGRGARLLSRDRRDAEQILRAANVLWLRADRVEARAIERDVVVGVTNHPAERALLRGEELVE